MASTAKFSKHQFAINNTTDHNKATTSKQYQEAVKKIQKEIDSYFYVPKITDINHKITYEPTEWSAVINALTYAIKNINNSYVNQDRVNISLQQPEAKVIFLNITNNYIWRNYRV